MTTFDVFLSHASTDKPSVEALARRLRDDGLEPFLDEWHLVPGQPWQEGIEEALETSRTCAVFVGKKLGPWQNEEMRAALDERAHNPDYRVIPVLLPGASRPGSRGLPLFLRRLTWVDFRSGFDDEDAYRRLVSGIRGVAPGAGTASPVPAAPYRAKLPPHDFFVPRRELDQIRDLLTGAAGSTVGITTALRGAGGFGKTALARALCDDPEVRSAYPDGILWTTMGERLRDANRIDRVLDLVRWWTDEEPPGFKSARDAGAYLKKALAGERVLVVVDDVWQGLDLEPFRELEPGTVLATTRNVRTLPEGTHRVDVDAMAPSEAVALLAHGLPSVDHGRLGALAERLGEWPLLLRLVSSQLLDLVRERGLDVPTALGHVESRLSKAGHRAFNRRDATERNEALSLTMNVSLDALSPEDRKRYLDLAVFPEDVDIPIGIVERLWGLEDWETEDLCHLLDDLSLLVDLNVARQTIRLHDVVRQYLIGEHDDLPALHRRLLERCRPASGCWTDLANAEAYLWRHLAGHIVGAGERAEVRGLLYNLDYLEGKLRAVGINALLADYDLLGDTGQSRTVQEALRLSAHVLARDWGELQGQVLAGQFLGRLEPIGDEGRRLLERAAKRVPLRPRRVSMSRPGGPLIRILEGHTGTVWAVAVLDETRVVSASRDGTLRVWNMASGETIRTLESHTDRVKAVAVLNETSVVSAPSNSTLRVWDVVSGETISSLAGHTRAITAVAVLDETLVVSASSDRTLRAWDVASAETIRTFKGHTNEVISVAMLNETRVVSASSDRTLRVWDVALGESIAVYALDAPLTALAATADGRTVVAGDRAGGVHFLDLDLP